jgi:hypothetical protein
MERGSLGALLTGLLFICFGSVLVACAMFKVRHWSDWPDRLRVASPIVRLVLNIELLRNPQLRGRRVSRSRRQTLLWEAPGLLLGGSLVLLGLLLAGGSIGQ